MKGRNEERRSEGEGGEKGGKTENEGGICLRRTGKEEGNAEKKGRTNLEAKEKKGEKYKKGRKGREEIKG